MVNSNKLYERFLEEDGYSCMDLEDFDCWLRHDAGLSEEERSVDHYGKIRDRLLEN